MPRTSRILLVDDDPIMRELAKDKLSDAVYELTLAENGAQALKYLRAKGADLVISDIEMPVMDGYELTEAIRADRKIRQTPVMVITASDRPEAVEQAFAAGATSFLAKPINWTLFAHSVKFVLRASRDEQALRVARDQAQAGERFKDGLMSVMSHELRTPLNAIIGFGQLLGEQFAKQNDALHREYADYIVDGGRRLLNNISDMLLASDAQAGPIVIDEIETPVFEIIEEAQSIAANAIKAAKAEVTVKIQNPDLEVYCDRKLIARALSKLLENAVKFADRGVKIIIAAAVTKDGDLAIMVKDNGPGIEAERLKQITVPFSQLDLSSRRSKEGLGLGLPLTQAIAMAHDARFSLQSEPGAGSRAILVMPAVRIGAGAREAVQNVA